MTTPMLPRVTQYTIIDLLQLLDVSDDGYLSLMDDGGNTRDDLKNPDGELGEEIKGAIGDGKDILVRKMVGVIFLNNIFVRFFTVHGAVRLRRGVRDCH